MKLVLTSNGISSEKVEKEVVKLCEGREKLDQKKVLVIRSSRKDPDEYAKQILEELKDAGFPEDNIDFANPFREEATDKMEDYDVYFSAGGNTFTILKSMKEKGYDELIKKIILEDEVYIGASAGTIILQKDIEIAGVGKDSDDNYIGLEDLSGLGIVDFEIFPHYEKENEENVKKYEEKKGTKVRRIKDGDCIVVSDSKAF